MSNRREATENVDWQSFALGLLGGLLLGTVIIAVRTYLMVVL